MNVSGRALLVLAILGLASWAALAVYLGPPQSAFWALAVAAVGLVAAISAILPRLRWWPLALFAVAVIVFLVRWSGVQPSNDRDWQTDVAVLPFATFDGDLVTIHNIRNFDYRTETDYTPRHYDKTYDLRQLDSADLIAVYWMGDAIAHIMASFGFAGQDFLAVSIETRKERGETYDTLRGFFRQYELIYIVGDERDLIRLRTNYRKDPPEEAYLYRTNAPPENVRRLFLSYLEKINELRERPAFYNTLTTNCTTNVLMHSRVNPGTKHYSWKILLSGYAPLYTYELGRLDTSLPFEELRRRSHINAAAQAADQAADFSQRIRAGLPKSPQRATPTDERAPVFVGGHRRGANLSDQQASRSAFDGATAGMRRQYARAER